MKQIVKAINKVDIIHLDDFRAGHGYVIANGRERFEMNGSVVMFYPVRYDTNSGKSFILKHFHTEKGECNGCEVTVKSAQSDIERFVNNYNLDVYTFSTWRQAYSFLLNTRI